MEKYLYIRHDVENHFIDFDEKLLEEDFKDLGETYQDYLDNKWVLLTEEQKAFYEENPTASVKEVWDMELYVPSEEELLYKAKNSKLEDIVSYDNSKEINSFTINNSITSWLTPEERSNYRTSIDAAKLVGNETISFFIDDTLITLSIQQAEMMLAQIQVYADQCFIVTKQHKLRVEALDNIQDVENYNYRTNYPEKINFNIE